MVEHPQPTPRAPEPRVRANGIELACDVMGQGEPLVLIMGIASQMIWWPEGFCRLLVERGFRVIRFDNRDAGLSTQLEGRPDLGLALLRRTLGLPVDAPYTLSDMAADVVGLLDALNVPRAHVAGASMGGMIAQTVALEHPDRVRSLTSMMSTPGNRRNGVGTPRAVRALLSPRATDRDGAIERMVRVFRVIGSSGFPFDEPAVRALAAQSYDRGHNPEGFARQMAAILSSGDRTHVLRQLRTPTLVLHGTADPLIPPRAARATARAIPGARMEWIEGMGHDLPAGAWPQVADAIARHAFG